MSPLPRTGALLGGLRLVAPLAEQGVVVLWDAVAVDSGERTSAIVERGELRATRRLAWTLADLLAGEEPAEPDIALAAAVAVALLSGPTRGDAAHPARGTLSARTLYDGRRWEVWGAVDGGEASELLAALDPSDELGLRGLFAAGAPEGRSASIPGALAVFLARARHTLVRRLGRDVSESRTQRLRRLAARLAAAANPPVGELGSLRSDGRELRGDADAVVWDGTTLAPRAARAALRALAAASDAPLRRWLAAMSRLRVDRELLRMRD